MWRKSLHSTHGFFDETFFFVGDFEFWNRLANAGVRFKKVAGISGLFYQNPRGISTDQEPIRAARRDAESKRIVKQYSHAWGW